MFSDAALTVVAVETIQITQRRTPTGYQLFGTAEPIAVVVCAPDGVHALDMAAKPIDFGQLRQDIPAFDSIIAASGISPRDS